MTRRTMTRSKSQHAFRRAAAKVRGSTWSRNTKREEGRDEEEWFTITEVVSSREGGW